jgi:hypothetical protein
MTLTEVFDSSTQRNYVLGANAILLPTVSNKVRHNHAEIEDYFVHFLAKGPRGAIDEANVQTFGNIAINSGVYTFSFQDGSAVQFRPLPCKAAGGGAVFVFACLPGFW